MAEKGENESDRSDGKNHNMLDTITLRNGRERACGCSRQSGSRRSSGGRPSHIQYCESESEEEKVEDLTRASI